MYYFSYLVLITYIVQKTSQTPYSEYNKLHPQLRNNKQLAQIQNKQYLSNQLEQKNSLYKLALYDQNCFEKRKLQTCNYNAYYYQAIALCYPCNSNIVGCQTCSNDGTICNTCYSQYIINSTSSTNQCPSCSKLFRFCLYCNLTECLTCNSGTLISGRCCLTTQYYNSVTAFCDNCTNIFVNCSACSQIACSACLSGNYLNIPNSSCLVCTTKFISCTTCDQTQCLSCSSGTLMSGLCCLSNQYYNSSKSICDNCLNKFSYCNTCDFTQCLTCSSGTLISGHCCLSNQYYNSTIIACDSCSHKYLGCGTCNSLNCLSCLQGYFYNLTFKNCAVCSVKFALCDLCDSTQCLNCLEGILTSGKCSCLQTQFYFQINNSCNQCSSRFPNCKTCDQSICSSCLTGPFNVGICCAGNEYYSKISNSCIQTQYIQCPDNCLKCTYGICLVCDNNFAMLLNGCFELSNDPDVKYLALITGTVANIAIRNPLNDIINKNPLIKKSLNNVLGLLGSIDDLWIFSYHERNYTLTIALLLNSIRQLQSTKFNAFSRIQLIQNFTLEIINYFNNLTNYGKQKYIAIEMKGSGFYPNIVQFIVMTVLQNIVIFLIFRFCFKLLINHKVSIFFREYTFNCYFVFSLLQGNMQFFTYICSNQLQTFFHFSISTKISNLIFILLFYLFIQTSLTIYFMLKYFYNNQVIYFMENNKKTIYGIFILAFVSSIRNITIAVISSFCSKNYKNLISLMNLTQLGFIFILILSLIIFKCFKSQIKFWVTLIFAFLRLTIQLSFACLRMADGNNNMQQKIQATILLIYLFYWILTILIFFFKSIFTKIFPINKIQNQKIKQSIDSFHVVKPLKKIYKEQNKLRIFINFQLNSRVFKIQQVNNKSYWKNFQILKNQQKLQKLNEQNLNNEIINRRQYKKSYKNKFVHNMFTKSDNEKVNKTESAQKQKKISVDLSRMKRILKSPQFNPNYLLIRKLIKQNQ